MPMAARPSMDWLTLLKPAKPYITARTTCATQRPIFQPVRPVVPLVMSVMQIPQDCSVRQLYPRHRREPHLYLCLSYAQEGTEMSLHDTSKSANCHAMSDVLNRIGDKWSVMVVGMLGRNGTLRFNELKRLINGVSQRMLTLTLRNLERDGLVTRTIYPEVPPRVEYGLTQLGKTLQGPISGLWDWSAENHTSIIDARAIYDARQTATATAEPRKVAYARGD